MVRNFRAILVCNGEFAPDSGLAPLKGPARDTERLAKVLADPEIGFHRHSDIVVVENGTKIDVLRAISRCLSEASANDQVLVYYSGHGLLDLHDQLYLCARDTLRSELHATAIWSRELNNLLRATRASTIVVLLDCCYAGAFNVDGGQTRGSGDVARCFEAEGLFVLGSAGSDELAGDSAEGGVFTQHVIRALEGDAVDLNRDGVLSLEDVYAYVRPRLKGAATPTMTIVRGVEYPPLAKARVCSDEVPPRSVGTTEAAREMPERRAETAGSGAQPELPIRLSALNGSMFLAVGLVLNGLLAVFGSLTQLGQDSGFTLLYWPAFLVGSLAAIYFGPWGIALSALSPLATALLFGDAFVAYLPSGVLQPLLVLAAFRVLRIDRALQTWRERARYVVFCAALPSAVGGILAWFLLGILDRTKVDRGALLYFTTNWTIENVLPTIVPGFWLFRVIAENYRPFTWETGRRPVGWMRRSLEISVPWLMSLVCMGVMLIVIAVELGGSSPLGAGDVPAAWEDFRKRVGHVHALPVTALLLGVSLLYAMGSAMQHSKQSWALVEAVRRHLPNRRISELLTSGIGAPTEQRVVTILITGIRGFAERTEDFSPSDVITWLNAYFARMCEACARRGGSIDKFMGDGLVAVFGLQTDDTQAGQAILCGLDMLDAVAAHNAAQDPSFPPIRIGIGLATGIVVAGEIGSSERRQYTVIGSTVDVAAKLEKATKGLPGEVLELLLSRETARQAGLLGHPARRELIANCPVELDGAADVRQSCAIAAHRAPDVRRALERIAARKGTLS